MMNINVTMLTANRHTGAKWQCAIKLPSRRHYFLWRSFRFPESQLSAAARLIADLSVCPLFFTAGQFSGRSDNGLVP